MGFISSLTQGSYKNKDRWHTTIVLDVSHSMNVTDWDKNGSSRLDVAKRKIQEIVSEVPHKYGLTVFSWSPQRIIPHTQDLGLFLTFLQWVDRGNVSQWGTDIELALQEATQDFIDENSGNIILFTDGWERASEDIADLRNVLKDTQVQVTIVGVGTKSWWPIVVGRDIFGRASYANENWTAVISRLWEANLKSLAKKIWGNYIHIDTFIPEQIWEVSHNRSFYYFSWTTMRYVIGAFACWMYFLVFLYIHIHIWIWRK